MPATRKSTTKSQVNQNKTTIKLTLPTYIQEPAATKQPPHKNEQNQKNPHTKNQNEKTTTGDEQTKQHVSAADTLPNERDGTATGGTPAAGVYPSTIYINWYDRKIKKLKKAILVMKNKKKLIVIMNEWINE